MTNHRQNKLRAVSLIEMIAVIALLSIVMGVVLSLFVSFGQWDRRMHDGHLRIAQTMRLVEQLRTDIRMAEGVTDQDGTLAVTMPRGAVITYQLKDHGCERTVNEPQEKPQTDEFVIGQRDSLTLDIRQEGLRPLVLITIGPHSGDATKHMPIVACGALGVDR